MGTTIENQTTKIANLEATVASLLIQQNVQRSDIDDLAANTYTKVEADETFSTKTDVAEDVQDLEDKIDDKIDKDATYSRVEADETFSTKTDVAEDVQDLEDMINDKIDRDETYSRSESDALFAPAQVSTLAQTDLA